MQEMKKGPFKIQLIMFWCQKVLCLMETLIADFTCTQNGRGRN